MKRNKDLEILLFGPPIVVNVVLYFAGSAVLASIVDYLLFYGIVILFYVIFKKINKK
jgi:hypothetical protein